MRVLPPEWCHISVGVFDSRRWDLHLGDAETIKVSVNICPNTMKPCIDWDPKWKCWLRLEGVAHCLKRSCRVSG